jgi:hypothetical protein
MFGKIREALSLEKWVENFEGYLDARIELAKFDIREAAIDFFTRGAIYASLAFLGLVCLLCLNFAIGYWLSSLFENSFSGFFLLTAFYLLLFLIIFFNRNNPELRNRIEESLRRGMNQPRIEDQSEEKQVKDGFENT